MSLPRIYANCPAGCKWETVHRDEFERSAAYVKQRPTDFGYYQLEAGKTYKIVQIVNDLETAGFWGLTLDIVINFNIANGELSETKSVTLPTYDKYSNIKFRLHEAYLTELLGGTPMIMWEYDVNGERSTGSITFEAGQTVTLVEAYGKVAPLGTNSEIEVLLINEDAETRARDGKSAYEVACDNGFEGTEQEWLDSLIGKDGKDGAGTEVTANPTETPTGALGTIKIDSVTYLVKDGTKIPEPNGGVTTGLIFYDRNIQDASFVQIGDGLKLEGGVLSISQEYVNAQTDATITEALNTEVEV